MWQARTLQGMRALQQAGEVAVVETAKALQEAVAAGKAHIEIRAHLDLTVLDLTSDFFNLLGDVPETVRSIRVRCWFLPPRTSHSQPRTRAYTNIMSVMQQ